MSPLCVLKSIPRHWVMVWAHLVGRARPPRNEWHVSCGKGGHHGEGCWCSPITQVHRDQKVFLKGYLYVAFNNRTLFFGKRHRSTKKYVCVFLSSLFLVCVCLSVQFLKNVVGPKSTFSFAASCTSNFTSGSLSCTRLFSHKYGPAVI